MKQYTVKFHNRYFILFYFILLDRLHPVLIVAIIPFSIVAFVLNAVIKIIQNGSHLKAGS